MAPLFYTRRQAQEMAAAQAQAAVKKQSIIDQISIESLDRAKADVQKWRDAIEYWEDTKQPDRYEMMHLYAEIVQDDAVSTHINTILSRIDGTAFEVGTVSEDGTLTPDKKLTEIMDRGWLNKVIRYVIEAELMGHSLVEITQPAPGYGYKTDNVKLIPREYVIPEWKKVRIKPEQNIVLIDYTAPQYYARLLDIGDADSKGLFNSLALLYIYKKNALAFWANYQSKFGIPPVVVKTDLTDKTKVDSLTTFLQGMRNNSFSIVGYDDTVDVLDGVNSDVHQTYLKLIEHCDAQIAKVLEGQTMTSSDGSSRSQAEVHERTGENLHMSRLRRVETVINEQLLPIIAADNNINAAGVRFRFNEVKDIDEIIERAVKLKQAGYSVDVDYMSELTGLPLTAVATATPGQPAQTENSIIKAIDELYNDKNGCHC